LKLHNRSRRAKNEADQNLWLSRSQTLDNQQ
jgi:hypothetical protein